MSRPKRQPTEKTPKCFEVRVPKRGEVMANLKKIAGKKPPPPKVR